MRFVALMALGVTVCATSEVVEIEVGESVVVDTEIIGEDAEDYDLAMQYSWPAGAFQGPGEPPYVSQEPIELVAVAATADPVVIQAEVVYVERDSVEVPVLSLDNPDSVHARWRPVRLRVRIVDAEIEAEVEVVDP